ncbi:hypothetical protein ACHQM5_012040 [Ranunculus cassubicifolius]
MQDNSSISELWEWNEQDYIIQKDPQLDIDHSLWDGDQNEQLSYIFDESTPVRDCGDLAYDITNKGKYTNKEFEGYSSQSKRRRMLQFDTHSTDSLLCTENTEYTFDAFEKSQDQVDLMEDVSQEDIPWESGPYGGKSTSCDGSLDHSSETWLSNCFNDGCMNLSSDDMNLPGFSDDQIDISELCTITDEMESDTVQAIPTPPAKIIYKGRKSHIRTPTHLASSIVYPFALVKPCGVHGDVTIKDINQRIHTPAPSPYAPAEKEESPCVAVSYPTSAFSGKPVVVKTKIRTEGGKGSITITRTKG